MSSEEHWSSPNGCHPDCPACAAERKIVVKVPTIYMDGGLITGVEGFPPLARFDVIDYDTEGVDTSDLCNCEAGDAEHYHSERKTNENGQH